MSKQVAAAEKLALEYVMAKPDGRADALAVLRELKRLRGWLSGKKRFPGMAAARRDLSLCVVGGGHWNNVCGQRECVLTLVNVASVMGHEFPSSNHGDCSCAFEAATQKEWIDHALAAVDAMSSCLVGGAHKRFECESAGCVEKFSAAAAKAGHAFGTEMSGHTCGCGVKLRSQVGWVDHALFVGVRLP